MRRLVWGALALSALLGLGGCQEEKEGPLERLGREADEAIEETEEALDAAREEAERE
jgi:hypothetical protein